jgi:hypothetical protein
MKLKPFNPRVDLRASALRATLLASLLVSPFGCKGGAKTGVAPTGIRIGLASATLANGNSEIITAAEVQSDGSTVDVSSQATWGSSDSYIADVTCANNMCTLVGSTEGAVTISAAYDGFSGTVDVTVALPTISSITAAVGSPSIPKGTTTDATATATLTDMSSYDVTSDATWKTSDASIATVACTSGTCVVTGNGVGMANLTATDQGNTSVVAIAVTAPIIATIALTPSAMNIAAGMTEAFQVTATLTDQSTEDATSGAVWTSTNNAIATVDANGLVNGIAQGQTGVTATVGAATASALVTVTPAVLTAIAVSPQAPTMLVGQTLALTVEGTFSDATHQDVTAAASWADTDTTGSVATVSSGGLVTATGSGQATFTATVTSGSGSVLTNSTTVSISAPATQIGLQITTTRPSVPLGSTFQMHADGVYSGDAQVDVTGQASWSSGDTSIATISSGGLITAKAMGMTSIGATLNGFSDSTMVTVTVPAPSAITITAPPVHAGDLPVQLTATARMTDGSSGDVTGTVTWASSMTGIATVDVGGELTPVAAGTTTITATSANDVVGSLQVTVGAALTQVVISPMMATLSLGSLQRLTASGIYGDGTSGPVTEPIAWTAAPTATAFVTASQASQATAFEGCNASGPATITATVALASGSPLTATTSLTCQ